MNLRTETGTQIKSLKSSASAGEVSPPSATAGRAARPSVKAGGVTPPQRAPMSRRGRRAVPALKNARFALAQAQRDVARHEKAVRKAAEGIGSTLGAKISAKSTAALKKTTSLLRAAKGIEEKAIKALASVISAEAAKSRL